ncbi:hypothetical protein GQ457_04G012780 [Hibiscus cannabinus]
MVMKAELVFIPMPRMGHFLSMVQVAKLLVDLDPHLSITFLILNLIPDAKLHAYVLSLTRTPTARIKFLNLPQPETDNHVTRADFIRVLVDTHGPLVKQAVTGIVHSVPDSPPLAGFVLDMFLTPLIDLGNEFDVPSYVFYTSGAAFLGFQLYALALHEEQNVNIPELKDSDAEFNVPSYINPVSSKLFPTVMLKSETVSMVMNVARGLREAKGIMVNTFWELEPHALSSLSEGKAPPVYPVGPLLNLESTGEVHIMEWLDEQAPSSVVFLCFGSGGSFNGEQVKEIACALEQSAHRFLWSLRQPPDPSQGPMASPRDYDDVSEVLPKGFLERTAGMGKIIGWAPQVAILGHPAIGGFVTHCGWNSTLESIWFGVPMAAWPLYAEQQLNAWEVVRELGLGVEIKMDYRKEEEVQGIVEAEKIEKGIRGVMEADSDVRRRVKEMKDKSRKALKEGRSSHSMLRGFIANVMDMDRNL